MNRLWLMLYGHLRGQFSRSEIRELKKAYLYADRAHFGKLRDDGTPYITHPVRSVIIAITAGERDVDTLIAILLHDVYEETVDKRYPKKFTHVHKEFGQLPAYRVHIMTKYDHTDKGKILYWATLRKCSDHGAKKGKICDRTDNIETLDEVDQAKKPAKLKETEREFIPLFRWLANDIRIKFYRSEDKRQAELAIVRNLYLRLKYTMEKKYNIQFVVPELD